MTREEQIEQESYRWFLKDFYETNGGENPDQEDVENAFQRGAEWADQHPNWIPVEERFPEENTTPLVRMDLSDKFNEETIIYDVVVFDQNGFHTPYKVTHWMEIQPPRKEEE